MMRTVLAVAVAILAAGNANAAERLKLHCTQFERHENGAWVPDTAAPQARDIWFDLEVGESTNAGFVNDEVVTGARVVIASDRLVVALYHSIFESSDVDVTRIEYYRTGTFEGAGHVYWSELVDESGVGPTSGEKPTTTRAKCDEVK